MTAPNDKQFQMRVSEEFLKTIDDWRRQQDDLPSRAEAIRRLVEQALSPSKMSKDNYDTLDRYVRAVLRRRGISGDDLTEAVEDLMHPLTALADDGDSAHEFSPYMKDRLIEWKSRK